VVKLEISRRTMDETMLREGRDIMMLLPKKRNPPQKEGMCTWLIQAHMNIMMYG